MILVMNDIWQKWRYTILVWWFCALCIIILLPDYQRQVHLYYDEKVLYYPDTLFDSIIYTILFSLIPLNYWLLASIKWFRVHFIIMWLCVFSSYALVLFCLASMTMHNSSSAFFYTLWIAFLGLCSHLFVLPFLWLYMSKK